MTQTSTPPHWEYMISSLPLWDQGKSCKPLKSLGAAQFTLFSCQKTKQIYSRDPEAPPWPRWTPVQWNSCTSNFLAVGELSKRFTWFQSDACIDLLLRDQTRGVKNHERTHTHTLIQTLVSARLRLRIKYCNRTTRLDATFPMNAWHLFDGGSLFVFL